MSINRYWPYWNALQALEEEDVIAHHAPLYHKRDWQLEKGRFRRMKVRAEIMRRKYVDKWLE